MVARILIIEDEVLVAMELRFALEDLDYEVVGICSTVDEALAKVRGTDVDLALVDIHLSDGATGIDLGQKLATEEGVSVVFMTGNPGMVRGGVDGAIGVLTKPAHEASVKKAVDYAMSRRRGHDHYAPQGLKLFC